MSPFLNAQPGCLGVRAYGVASPSFRTEIDLPSPTWQEPGFSEIPSKVFQPRFFVALPPAHNGLSKPKLAFLPVLTRIE